MIAKFARLEFELFTRPSNSYFLRVHQDFSQFSIYAMDRMQAIFVVLIYRRKWLQQSAKKNHSDHNLKPSTHKPINLLSPILPVLLSTCGLKLEAIFHLLRGFFHAHKKSLLFY